MLLKWGTGSTFLSAAAGKGEGQFCHPPQVVGVRKGGHLSLTLTTTWQMRGVWPAILLSHTQGYLTHASAKRD